MIRLQRAASTAPARTAGGTRRYGDADLDWIRVITRLPAVHDRENAG